MAMTDPVADMLTRIRNALRGGREGVAVPASRMKEAICAVLKAEGYIRDYKRVDDGKQGMLHITLKYGPDRVPIIQGLRRVSKPSLRVRVKSHDIKPVRSSLGVSILTTSKGVMTGKDARREKLGGEVICEVW